MPTVASVPATFTGAATVAFSIPAASYTSAIWTIAGTFSGTIDNLNLATPNNLSTGSLGITPFSKVFSASAAQLSDINNAASGNLSVAVSIGTHTPGATPSITSFTLALSGGGGGNTYTESGGVIGKGVTGGSDTYTPGDPGPFHYTEFGGVVGIGEIGGTDSAQFPQGPAIYIEFGGVIGVAVLQDIEYPLPPPQIYIEFGGVTGLGLPLGYDSVQAIEFGGPIGKGAIGGSDSAFINGTGNNYVEYGGPIGKGVPGGIEILGAVENGGPVAKWQPGGADIAAYMQSGGFTGKGIPGSFIANGYTESGGVIGKGAVGGKDRILALEVGGPKGKAVVSGVDRFASLDHGGPVGKWKPGGGDIGDYIDHGGPVGKGEPGGISVPLEMVEFGGVVGKGKPGGVDVGRFIEKGGPIGKGVISGVSARVIIEFGGVTGKGKPGGADSIQAVESGGIIGVGVGETLPNDPDASQLIPNIRYHCKAALTGINNFPEASPDFFDRDPKTEPNPALKALTMAFPLCVIVAGNPTEKEAAVQMSALTVPVDLVVVQEEQAGIDNPQAMRQTIKVLTQALYKDYKCFGNTDVPASFNVRIVATPMQRQNQYEKYYRDRGQKVEVLVLSTEWDVLEIGYGDE